MIQDLFASQRCGAKNRRGISCLAPAMRTKLRCRLHGGLSTGPRTTKGKARSSRNSLQHGEHTAENKSLDRMLRRYGNKTRQFSNEQRRSLVAAMGVREQLQNNDPKAEDKLQGFYKEQIPKLQKKSAEVSSLEKIILTREFINQLSLKRKVKFLEIFSVRRDSTGRFALDTLLKVKGSAPEQGAPTQQK